MVTETWINIGDTRQRLATSIWAKGTSEVGSTTSTCSTTPCRPVKWSNYCKSSVLGKSSPIVRSCDQAMWPGHVIRSRDRVMWQVTTSGNVFRGYWVPQWTTFQTQSKCSQTISTGTLRMEGVECSNSQLSSLHRFTLPQRWISLNPFTPKSDQCQFSHAASPEI